MHRYAEVLLGAALAGGVAVVCWESPKRPPTPRSRVAQTADPEISQIVASSRAKREAAQRVLQQRLSLLEGAELFRLANGPAGLERLRTLVAGNTLHERLCQQVIDYVRSIESEMTDTQSGEARHSAVLAEELGCRRATGAFLPDPPGE